MRLADSCFDNSSDNNWLQMRCFLPKVQIDVIIFAGEWRVIGSRSFSTTKLPFPSDSLNLQTEQKPSSQTSSIRQGVLVDLNASRAARDVGYAAKSASVEGSRLLANAEVQAENTRQRAILMAQTDTVEWSILPPTTAPRCGSFDPYLGRFAW